MTAADVATATEAAAALGELWLSSGPSAPGTPPAKPASPSAAMPTCDAHPYQRQLPRHRLNDGDERSSRSSTGLVSPPRYD
ncbi:hypothetical protein NUT86_32995 [Streptomyces sp. G7(2002)]|nr:hypothetical protein [Streptomyces sp. G7(2002)]WDT60188.1 hypothetical protein NUT86_32995 [Streptomyces sp. G7(2002)]